MSFTVINLIRGRIESLTGQAESLHDEISDLEQKTLSMKRKMNLIEEEIAELEEFRSRIPTRSGAIWFSDASGQMQKFDNEYWLQFTKDD